MTFRVPFLRLLLSTLALGAFALGHVSSAQQFTLPVLVSTGNNPVSVYSVDVNADGLPDLVVVDAGATGAASTTRVLLGDGKGKFTQSAVIPSAGPTVAIGDTLGTGKISIAWVTSTPASACTNANSSYCYYVITAAGNGDGTFAAPQTTQFGPTNFAGGPPAGTPLFNYVVAVNTFGAAPVDVVAQNTANNTLFVFSRQNYGHTPRYTGWDLASYFNTPVTFAGPVALGDLDHDGFVDLVVNDTRQSMTGSLMNQSANFGRLYSAAPYSPASGVHSLVVRDMDGDGIPDMLAEDTNGSLQIYKGYGDGTFASSSEIGSGANDATTGRGGHVIGVADLNGDGVLDIITATPLGISVLLGQGNLSYKLLGIYDCGPGRTSFALADFDRDGHVDLAVDNPQGVEILFGRSDGSFGVPHALSASLAATPEPSGYGHSFTLTAAFKTAATDPAPSGSVTFSVDGAAVGTSPVSGSAASYTVPSPTLAVGPHALSAVYTGDANYAALTLTGTHAISLLPSYTYLTNLTTTYHYGQTIASTSIVHADAANPSVDFESTYGGSIDVYEDGVKVCTLPYTAAGASCPPTTGSGYSAGVHTIYLQYSGNQYFAPSTSVTYSVTILPDDTLTTLLTSSNPASAGTAVTFTASTSSGYLIPPGAVAFYDGTTLLGSVGLNNAGTATYTTSTLSPGTHSVTASYVATQNFNASTSAVVSQLITTGVYGVSMTITPSTLSVPIGSSVSVLVTVAETGGFNQPIELSCGGLVREATCSFAATTIPAGGGSTRLTVAAAAPHNCGTDTPYFVASGPTEALEALAAGLLIVLVRRRRRLVQGIVLGLLLGILPALAGCGNCTDLGVRPGTYSFTVNGVTTTPPSASVSQTLQMNAHL